MTAALDLGQLRGTSTEKVNALVQTHMRDNPKVSAMLAVLPKLQWVPGLGAMFTPLADAVTFVLDDLPNMPAADLDALCDRAIETLQAVKSDDTIEGKVIE